MINNYEGLQVAVLIPCYNEASTISQVVTEFRAQLPTAKIVVFDNNSTDQTIANAKHAGAEVRTVRAQGKGNVVRRMFADIEADIYILIDGDATYQVDDCHQLLETLLDEHLDMVVGMRVSDEQAAYRAGHRYGNQLFNSVVAAIFGRSFADMLSGYRVMSRRFVKSFPLLTDGFEIETELTIHALQLKMPTTEVETRYLSRPSGSYSKLNTYSDGIRILRTVIHLFRQEKPLLFFSLLTALFAIISMILAMPLFMTYLQTGLVPRFPTAMLSTGLMLLAFLSLASGLILDSVARGRYEMKRLHYLSIPATSRLNDQ
jgi:glycosyltransferase involved in cell wall biosynthesis